MCQVKLSCTGRVSCGLAGLSANIPIEKLPPLICVTEPPDLSLAAAYHYRPLETRAVSTFGVHPSLLGSEKVYGPDFPLHVLTECIQDSWLMAIVTPAAAPKTDVKKDWNRFFLLVTNAHLIGFDIVRGSAYIHNQSTCAGPSMLAREGQLLPLEPSAKTHVFEVDAGPWKKCLKDDATYTLEIRLSFFLKKEIRNHLATDIPREVADMIFDDLDVRSLASLASTCKDLRASLLETYARLKHIRAAKDKIATDATPMIVRDDPMGRRVRQLFSTLFPDDPQGFRNLLGNTRAIISEPCILTSPPTDTAWLHDDVCLVVPAQTEVEVVTFLVGNGYCETRRVDLQSYRPVEFSLGEKNIELAVVDASEATPINYGQADYITATHLHCACAELPSNCQNLRRKGFSFSPFGVKAVRKYSGKILNGDGCSIMNPY